MKLKEKELRLAKEIMKETILKAKVDRKGEVLKKANERIIKLKRKGTKTTSWSANQVVGPTECPREQALNKI